MRTVAALCVLGCCAALNAQIPVLKEVPTPETSNKVEGLELTGPQTVPTYQKVVIVLASAQGPVRWEVRSLSGEAKSAAVDERNLLVFLGGKQDTVIVTAVTVVKGQPSATATTTITVTDGKAAQIPVFQKAGNTKKAAHVTFILPKAPTELAKEVRSLGFKKKLAALGVEWHEMEPTKIQGDWVEAVRMAGIPCLVIQNAQGDAMRVSSLITVEEALKVIAQEAGK